MTVPEPQLMAAVEHLGYRVTVGDVAAQTGWQLDEARQGLLALASAVGGHLQVAESGDIAYLFPRNFRAILLGKSWQLRWRKAWQQVGQVLFYLIRISFGIFLILSIILIFVAIALILLSMQSSDQGDANGGRRRGARIFWFPDLSDFFLIFHHNSAARQRQRSSSSSDLNFLEAIFSFLFGDGNPNDRLEERRWQAIATTIRHHHGVVVAEELAPYLDELVQGYDRDYENYLLPVLVRFDGHPEVTPEGGIIYQFPQLQVTATAAEEELEPSYLQEYLWRFSRATSTQIMLTIGLGSVNLIGAMILGSLLVDGTVAQEMGGLVAFVESIYGILLGYGIGFLGIPLGRYFWIRWANRKIEQRNQKRRDRTLPLRHPSPELKRKLDYAQQLGQIQVINPDRLAYSTETDLVKQEINALKDRWSDEES